MKRSTYPISRTMLLVLTSICAGWCLSASALEIETAADLRGRYLETLRLLSSAGIEATSGALFELETTVAQQYGADGLDQLRGVELEVAEELATVSANLLLPLIALHERAHLEYRSQALEANPNHGRVTVYLQTQLYSEQLRTPEERKIASDLFVSLAGHFQEGSTGPGAASLYTRALQFDPANEAALLGLASVREQTGRYRNALALLERLAETSVADPEARLRLAINLERLGKRSEAERILENLTSESAPDWISNLAFQQLARIRLDQERFEAGHTYLTRGVARFPDDLGLAIGLAYVEERLGLDSEPPLVAGAPSRDTAFGGSSARYRYARPGNPFLGATRERLREAARRSLPDLAHALSGQVAP
jgi:Flp pilus assembly protein TadD